MGAWLGHALNYLDGLQFFSDSRRLSLLMAGCLVLKLRVSER